MKGKKKTKKSLAKRFKITKNGKVLHRSSLGRHLKSAKGKSQKSRYRKPKELTGKMAKKVKKVGGK